MWDLTCLVSWGDKCFLCDQLGHTGLFTSVQPNPFGATKAPNSVLLISLQENHLATCFWILFDPASLNESCPRPTSYSNCCFVLWLKDQTHHDKKSRRTLLGNWCQRGRERSSHQSLIISIGGENTLGKKETPDAWCSRGEKSHVFKRGKTCSYLLDCISSIYFLWALILLWVSVPYLLPISHVRFRGSKTSKGRKSLNLLHIFTFGDMPLSNVVLSTHSTCHPSLGTLVVSLVCSGQ